MITPLSILLATFNTYSILGIIHLILFIWAVVQIIGSGMSLIVFLLPVIGLILYYLIGRKA